MQEKASKQLVHGPTNSKLFLFPPDKPLQFRITLLAALDGSDITPRAHEGFHWSQNTPLRGTRQATSTCFPNSKTASLKKRKHSPEQWKQTLVSLPEMPELSLQQGKVIPGVREVQKRLPGAISFQSFLCAKHCKVS